MPRKKGLPNRNYPNLGLEDALEIPRAIQDHASGMPTSKLDLAEFVGRSPASSQLRERLLASRAYGLTEGGVNAEEFRLTQLGDEATGVDDVARQAALKEAVFNIEPFRAFLLTYDGKKVPSTAALKTFLSKQAGVPEAWVDDAVERVIADAKFAGLLRNLRGALYVDLSGGGWSGQPRADSAEDDDEAETEDTPLEGRPRVTPRTVIPDDAVTTPGQQPMKVFIAHGKNRRPLEQLKTMLDQFKVKYAVAVDAPHQGRPISAKVAELMREQCSSAIFIFTADEGFLRETNGSPEEVWRPSENVVYELGAASVLYDRRIVIFKEKGVTFPSDFADLGYIEFEKDGIAQQMGQLFAELVALDILEVRAKG